MSFSADQTMESRGGLPDAVVLGVLASLLLHLALFGAAVWWPRRQEIAPPSGEGVPVDFVTPEQYEAAIAPAAPAAAAPAQSPAPPATPPSPFTAPGMVHAGTMLSALALAEPGTAQAAKELAHFAPDERAVQLCNLEAMQQVQAWRATFKPEHIIAYATADVATDGDEIRAPGAAFLSAGQWYGLDFVCQLSGDHGSVVDFAFKVGQPIPRADWDADHLPTAK